MEEKKSATFNPKTREEKSLFKGGGEKNGFSIGNVMALHTVY